MSEKIWLSSPHMGGEEQKFVSDAFESNWIAPLGPNVNGFEEDIVKYTHTKAASALSSGTAALHLALILSGVEAGDEVLCSSFTFSASCNPIVYQHATPIFVDSEKKTWNIDPELLEEAIKDRIKKGTKPKALIVVHLYGMPALMDEIAALCKKYEIILIEDAAEAMGSTYKGVHMGTLGDFGVFSFNGNKIITTSGGGALVANDGEIIQKSRFLATQARDQAPHYQHSHIGYNYRMSNITAGIGRGQMLVLDERVKQRRANFKYYSEVLKDIPGIEFQPELEGLFSNRWLTCLTFEEKGINDKVRLALENENIEARPLWKPMHLQPVFKKYPAYLNGISEDLFDRGLCLPSGSNLAQKDLDRIVETILKTLN